MDRLFVPLSSEPFEQFAQGIKEYEVRKYGRQFTEKHVYTGRHVELRKGYSSNSLWGIIGDVHIGALEKIIAEVDYKKVEPTAESIKEAAALNKEMLGDAEKYILFEIALDPRPENP